ncbi:curli assembly protein CsgE [Lacinutrix sp. 5H-3-7-4]|uniref:curli assembly protein CsgE n=1 Tax=Lacinutrix sp. (strain 5H-3-7-4) TaxID=983544 RepID=UPI00020A393D|nr:curli assembly protein CsgE [Lacinutrix sp. 5H-3-7-4]AEH00142.1 Curli assembly protein CsgE [Lacinutrix sp. 5H-3-7-4]
MLSKLNYTLLLIFVLSSFSINAQKFYNKDINALIKIEKSSEFTKFSATAENLKFSAYNLRYEFLAFKTDVNNNSSKSSQSNNFYLEANQKKVLSSLTINNDINGKIILVLLIYPIIDGEKNVGAIGKDRVVLTSNENGQIVIELDPNRKEILKEESQDLANTGQDGVFLQGLVIQKTLTKAGRDFHRYFYSEYFNRQIKTDKHIVIEEVPGQRRSTRISVKVDGRLVWQFFVNPKKKFLLEMVNIAMQKSIRYLQLLQKSKETITQY